MEIAWLMYHFLHGNLCNLSPETIVVIMYAGQGAITIREEKVEECCISILLMPLN